MDWITEHSEPLSLGLNLLMVFIWVAYLNIFLVSFLRQRRPLVLIHRSVGTGSAARCFVSNMGAEPIYLSALIADVSLGDETLRAFVTDREELTASDISVPSEATNQGPVASGGFVDAGSFGQILERALTHLGKSDQIDDVTRIRIIALCGSGHSTRIIAGARSFRVGRKDKARVFVPDQPSTDQLSSLLRRRRNNRILESQLEQETAALDTPAAQGNSDAGMTGKN